MGGFVVFGRGGGAREETVAVEVRHVCGECGGPTVHNGRLNERIRYRKCNDCGAVEKVELIYSSEVKRVIRRKPPDEVA